MTIAIKRFLTINPGSTSTKLATYVISEGKLTKEFAETISHSVEELQSFSRVTEQFEFRKNMVTKWLQQTKLKLSDISVFVGRGGFVRPISSGSYKVNALMLEHLRAQIGGKHASNLGGMIAHALANLAGHDQAYIVDPTTVDELIEEARLSGIPELPRISKVHTLNHKAVAHLYAESINRQYEDLNLLIMHMGGGTSIAAHRKGLMIDVNNGLDGEGTFTPERCGGLPTGDFMRLCYSGKFTLEEMSKKIKGIGGLVAYLGTNNVKNVQDRIKAGDQKAKLVFRAMAYQIAKDIGAYATVLAFDVDAILLTGGLAHSDMLCGWIEDRVKKIAPVIRYPGGDEEFALANGVYQALIGKRPIREY